MPPNASATQKEIENLHKQRRRIWRGIYTGKLDSEIFKPTLGKILDSILNLQHRERIERQKKL